MVKYYIYISIMFLFISCEDNSSARVYKLNKNPIKKDNAAIVWSVPSEWEEIAGNTFSLAVYKILNVKDYSEISVSKFPGDAGGVESNVNRWRRQVELSPLNLDQIISESITKINPIGRYSLHKIINNEKIQTAFLCMILPLDDSTIFVKLKSTKNEISNLEQSFIEFCSSFRFEND